jgi:hypothetical protein
MIFWVSNPNEKNLPAIKRNYEFRVSRLIGALVIVVVLIGFAYGSHLLNWDAGQSLFLSFAQLVFGTIAGVLAGEGAASRELSNSGTS